MAEVHRDAKWTLNVFFWKYLEMRDGEPSLPMKRRAQYTTTQYLRVDSSLPCRGVKPELCRYFLTMKYS